MARRKKQGIKSDARKPFSRSSGQKIPDTLSYGNVKGKAHGGEAQSASGAQARKATEVQEAPLGVGDQKEKKAILKECGAAAHESAGKAGVRVSTCIAGMFLALILGLYLGAMLPQIMQELAGKQPDAKSVPVPSQNPASQAEPGDSLARIIAGLEEKLKHSPNNADDWITLGNAYFDAGRPPFAISAYEHALALRPDNADVLTDLGIMYRESGRFDKALECFRRAITINPVHQNAMYNEGVVLAMDLDKKEDAERAWTRLLEINPQAKAPDGRSLREMIKNLH